MMLSREAHAAIDLAACAEHAYQPHELPMALWLIWADGFHAGADRMKPALAQAEADRDRYYYELYNSAEARARHRDMLKGFDVALARRSAAEQWAELDRLAAQRAAETRFAQLNKEVAA